jgi:hypothetical protein
LENILDEYARYISVNENFPIRLEATVQLVADSHISPKSDEPSYGLVRIMYQDDRNVPTSTEMNQPIYADADDRLGDLLIQIAHELREEDGLERQIEGNIWISTLRPELDAAGIYPVVFEKELYADYITNNPMYDPEVIEEGENLDSLFSSSPWNNIKTPMPAWMDMFHDAEEDDDDGEIHEIPDDDEEDDDGPSHPGVPNWICDPEMPAWLANLMNNDDTGEDDEEEFEYDPN